MIVCLLGSEDVGVEPNAGISSVRYQGVKALRGADHGDTFRTLKISCLEPQRGSRQRLPSEVFLFYTLPSRRFSSALPSYHSTCPSRIAIYVNPVERDSPHSSTIFVW